MKLKVISLMIQMILFLNFLPGQSSVPDRGYAVQVAALSKEPRAEKFNELEKFGKVYAAWITPLYHIRVGPYRSAATAKDVLASIKRTTKFNKAQLVYEEGEFTENFGSQVLFYDLTYVPDRYDQPVPLSTGYRGRSIYTIQVAASTVRPDMYTYDRLFNFGSLRVQEEGRWYKVRVGFYDTREEARRALRDINRLGYNRAFIIEEEYIGDALTQNPEEYYDYTRRGYSANLRTTHTVKKGENLYRIARRYGLTVNELRADNNIPNWENVITPGQILVIR